MRTHDEIHLLEMYESKRISRGYLRYMLKCGKQELPDAVRRIELVRSFHRFGGGLALTPQAQAVLRSIDLWTQQMNEAAQAITNAFAAPLMPAAEEFLAELEAHWPMPSRWERFKMWLADKLPARPF